MFISNIKCISTNPLVTFVLFFLLRKSSIVSCSKSYNHHLRPECNVSSCSSTHLSLEGRGKNFACRPVTRIMPDRSQKNKNAERGTEKELLPTTYYTIHSYCIFRIAATFTQACKEVCKKGKKKVRSGCFCMSVNSYETWRPFRSSL